LLGLMSFLAAFGLWDRARNQPEDIPMYSMFGHRDVSKKVVCNTASIPLILGIILVAVGLAVSVSCVVNFRLESVIIPSLVVVSRDLVSLDVVLLGLNDHFDVAGVLCR